MQEPSLVVELLSHKNKENCNPLYTSNNAHSLYYVLTWLLGYYEALCKENNNYNNPTPIMMIFASTHKQYGNILHFLAMNANIEYKKNHRMKELFDKTCQILEYNNKIFFEQLSQSRIPCTNMTPINILSERLSN